MSVREVKDFFTQVIEKYRDWDPYELRRLFTEAIREWELHQGWSENQKGEPWTDDELRAILSDAPTKEDCLKHARAFRRGYGAVEQIYRWAATPGPEIQRKRPDDVFIAQIKRVAKQLGWRA
jgi:hypothetical protein